MNRNIKLVIGLVAILLLVFSIIYFNGNSDSSEEGVVDTKNKGDVTIKNDNQQNDKNKEFPPEAIKACEELKNNDNCIFQTPNGEESGICTLIGKDLVCSSNKRGMEDRQVNEDINFPPEAIKACENLKEGSECIAETPDGEESGVCTLRGTELVCSFEKPLEI